MGLGIGLVLGGQLFYVCLSAKRKDCCKRHIIKSAPCFWPFSPQCTKEFFYFLFCCTKLHDKHGGIVGGGASKG